MKVKYEKLLKEPKALDAMGMVSHTILNITVEERNALHSAYLMDSIVFDVDEYLAESYNFIFFCVLNKRFDLLSSSTNKEFEDKYLNSLALKEVVELKLAPMIKFEANVDELVLDLLRLFHNPRTSIEQALINLSKHIKLDTQEDSIKIAAYILNKFDDYTVIQYPDSTVISGNYMFPKPILAKQRYATSVAFLPEGIDAPWQRDRTRKNKTKLNDNAKYYVSLCQTPINLNKGIASLQPYFPTTDKNGEPLSKFKQEVLQAQYNQLAIMSLMYDSVFQVVTQGANGRVYDTTAQKQVKFAINTDTTYVSNEERNIVMEMLK